MIIGNCEDLSKFIEFYWEAKKLRESGIKKGFGAGSLPSGFTEQLCRLIYGLDKFNKNNHKKKFKAKDFDAEKDGKLIEIKFNNSGSNALNVNLKKEFDYFYHTLIDFENDTYTVRIFNGKDIRKKYYNKENISTTIKAFSKELTSSIDTYRFNIDKFSKEE